MRTMSLEPHVPDNLLHDAYDGFIAGGYAACPERASDIDVWVTTHDDLHSVRRCLLAHLSAQGYAVFPETAELGVRVDGFGYDEMDVNILKVAVIERSGKLPIHLMVTDAPVMAVLLHFDVSTHQVALVPHYMGVQTIYGPEWTPLTDEPVQIKETSATNTRMEKIRTRYADMRTNGKI